MDSLDPHQIVFSGTIEFTQNPMKALNEQGHILLFCRKPCKKGERRGKAFY
jgi:hypothetical protein